MKKIPVIDLHCDTVLRLVESRTPQSLVKNRFHVDLAKMKKGGSRVQFFAVYVDLKKKKDPLELCLNGIDRFHKELAENPQDIALAVNGADVERNTKEGKISAFLTIEEGGVLKGNPAVLRMLHRLGVRLITLTWNYPNELGYPNCIPEAQGKGLTSAGREIVGEMNRLGMIVDVSHLSDRGFYDVAELSTKPFVASHSNARSCHDHTRNLTDDMIRVLGQKGGVTGINYEKSFVGIADPGRLEDMARHIRHIANHGGVEVVALGSDFDGISPRAAIANASQVPKLFDELRKNGFSEEDIEKIAWKNAYRVIQECCL